MFKNNLLGKKQFVTQKEKLQLINGQKQFSDIFSDVSEDMIVSFFPNGSDEIWIKSKSDHNLGFRLRFNSSPKNLSIEISNFTFGDSFNVQSTTIDDEEKSSKTTLIWQKKEQTGEKK